MAAAYGGQECPDDGVRISLEKITEILFQIVARL